MNIPRLSESGKMTINLPGVIKTLGESLYSDPGVSIRELIQNANDTCVVRQAEDPKAHPAEIHIRFDSWKRLLVVEDNGAGMTEEEVKAFLTVIGSSKTDEVRARLEEMGERSLADRLIGRFGLGLLSAFIIADRIEFMTLSYKEEAQAIWWQCDGGQDYQMGITEGKKTPGTLVTVHINPKHIGMLKDDKLTELIHMYADLLEVPIYLDPIPSPINVMLAPWHRQATEAEYRQFVANRYPNDAILDIIPIEIEEDEGKFKVGGVLFVPKQPFFIIREHGDAIIYVRHMFVCKDDRTLLPDWAKFVKGVIESSNLRETTSREAIQHDENFLRVQKAIGSAILNYLTRVSNENPRLFKEIVTNHNLVIKAWAIASDELFERIKDIVLFNTDAGLINLQRYFEMSRFSRGSVGGDGTKRHIFYFTTPGGEGQYTILFSARGLRVIDAQHFPDSSFLEKYANEHNDVVLKRLDIGGEFIFEEVDQRERKWVDLEEQYAHLGTDAKVVKFVPEDVPAVLIFPENESLTDQMNNLLTDPNLSIPLKGLVRQMWEDREKQRKGRVSGAGILHINANNPVIQQLADMDLRDNEILQIMMVIYHNAVLLSTQGSRRYLAADNAKKIFESNNRAIASLMAKISELRELRAKQLLESERKSAGSLPPVTVAPVTQIPQATGSVMPTKHITCFIALPFAKEYDILIEALRDVLEVAPYFWQVARADKQYFVNNVPDNVGKWIARSQCFAVELSEGNENVMMELGQMYWGYPERPLILLQREGTKLRMADLGERIRIVYPWNETPDQAKIATVLRREIEKFDALKNMKGDAHYLSTRIMPIFIAEDVRKLLVNHFTTVEDFVNKDASLILQEISTLPIGTGTVQDIQGRLRVICGLR